MSKMLEYPMLLYPPPISTVSLKSKVPPIWVCFFPSGISLALIKGFSFEPNTPVFGIMLDRNF